MTKEISDFFIQEVKRIFGFLLDYGFRLREQMIEVSPLLVRMPFVGQNLAIIVNLDYKDKVVDCCLAKVIDGEIIRDRSKGGYWAHLHAFLVKHHGFRGSIGGKSGKKDFLESQIVVDLEDYASVIKNYGKVLLTDAADVLPR